MSKRCTHRPEFKAMVARVAISGRKDIQEIAADQDIHPIQVSHGKYAVAEARQWAVYTMLDEQDNGFRLSMDAEPFYLRGIFAILQ